MADARNPNEDMLVRGAPRRGRAALWLWLLLLVVVAVIGRWYVWPLVQALVGSDDPAATNAAVADAAGANASEAADASATNAEDVVTAGAARTAAHTLAQPAGGAVLDAPSVADAERALVGLRSSVAQLQLQVSAAATGEGRLAELEHLLHMARQHAELETDPPTALRLLTAAEAILANSGDPRLLPVRVALTNDIAQVRSQAEIDVEGTYLRIGALAASAAALPFQQPVFVGDAPAASDSDQGLWSRAVQAARGLVRVRTDRNAAALPVLSQEGQAIVRQRIVLALDQASTAVLRGEEKVYRAALNRADALVRQHAQTSASATRRFRQELGQLVNTPGLRAAVHISALDALAQVPRMLPPGLLPPPEDFGAPVAAPLEGVAQTLPPAMSSATPAVTGAQVAAPPLVQPPARQPQARQPAARLSPAVGLQSGVPR